MNRRLVGQIVTVFLACGACASPPPPVVALPGDYGGWAAKPHAEWPHITMINEIEYTDARHPTAGCGFLVETRNGIVAATAKHVLLYFKSDSMDSVSFQGSMTSWRMFPKDNPSRVTVLGELINEDREQPLKKFPAGQDWLLFTVKERADGVQPLRFRTTPLQTDETVYVVGWRYPDTGPQRILEGRFVRTDRKSVLIDVPALTDNTIPGLSGSPVIDRHGYVIGLMSTKAGKLQRLAGIDYPMTVLEEAGETFRTAGS
jgi:hypothetical protein